MLVSTTGSPVGPFGYNGASGYQEDTDTGLMLLGHRYYDSSTGRFITRDPAKDGSNWYDYVRNNPLRGLDNCGLQDDESPVEGGGLEPGEEISPIEGGPATQIYNGPPNEGGDPAYFHPIGPEEPVQTNENPTWPPNDGFVTKTIRTLLKGMLIQRVGGKGGSYFSPIGMPPGAVSLAPESMSQDPVTYSVELEIPGVIEGRAMPWFGQRGGGLQWKTPMTLGQLLDAGYLKPVLGPPVP